MAVRERAAIRTDFLSSSFVCWGGPWQTDAMGDSLKITSMLAAVLFFSGVGQGSAQGPLTANIEPLRILNAQGFADEDGETATDLSGIACLPKRGAGRACFVINDENRSVQLAVLSDNRLVGGQNVPLIAKKQSADTLGEEPQNAACSGGEAKFKDLDGEAITIAGAYLYVAGSHGCSRKSNRFRSSSFIVARMDIDEGGKLLGAVETSYRLAEVLRNAPIVGRFFGQDLNDSGGLNIEGLAAVGDRLVVGLRAPTIGNRAFLIVVNIDHVFSKEGKLPEAAARVVEVPLGPNVGIRDLAALPDQRLLLLAGPAQDQSHVPYSIFLVDLAAPQNPKHLATLKEVNEDGAEGKAEGILLMDSTPNALRIVVIFDGIPNGGPREYLVPLR